MAGPYGNVYDKYSSSNPIVRKMVAGFFKDFFLALNMVDTPSNILEIGCGDGTISEKVRNHYTDHSEIFAMDPGLSLLKKSRNQYPGINFFAGSVYQLPFCDNSTDLVLIPEVMEHLNNPDMGLNEIIRVGCKFYLFSVPWEPIWRIGNMLSGRYLKSFGNTPGHIQHWNRQGFVRFIEEKLTIVKVFRPFPWTMILAKKA